MTQDAARLALLQALAARAYRFVTPTPDTHRIVLLRSKARRKARDLRDIFGWSRSFGPEALEPELLELMRAGGLLAQHNGRLKSRVRVSSLHDRLFLHSAFPTKAKDSVFFGPDSYRFADFIRAELGAELGEGARVGALVDIGAGSGVGAIVAAGCAPGARVVMSDVNPAALRLARVNARHAGVEAEFVLTSGLDGVGGPLDLVIANPPYVADRRGRSYRDGGEMMGAQLSLDWAKASAARLAPGGRLLLYTGVAIVDGADPLLAALQPAVVDAGCALRYRELDPDVFGMLLAHPAYWAAERVAAVGAVVTKER